MNDITNTENNLYYNLSQYKTWWLQYWLKSTQPSNQKEFEQWKQRIAKDVITAANIVLNE